MQVLSHDDVATTAPAADAATSVLTEAGGDTANKDTDEKSDEYSEEMQQKMGTLLTYRHEAGMNYNFILPDLIVGSCLQTPADVDRLAEAGVTTVFSLQVSCYIITLHHFSGYSVVSLVPHHSSRWHCILGILYKR